MMKSSSLFSGLLCLSLVSLALCRPVFVERAVRKDARPSINDFALMSQWLVHTTNYGTLATLSSADGTPDGCLVSHSDGSDAQSSGRILFYLSPLDECTQNIEDKPSVSYTVSEAQSESGCSEPEDPTCARITAFGKMARILPVEKLWAETALFSRHPQMADWPTDHEFTIYELQLDVIHLLDNYGGQKLVTAAAYYAA